MVKYKRIFFTHYGYGEQDFIPCFNCSCRAVDIHHLIFKSQGGKDEIDNLVALCRNCHDKAHSDKKFNQYLVDANNAK